MTSTYRKTFNRSRAFVLNSIRSGPSLVPPWIKPNISTFRKRDILILLRQ